jgi:hypothetical protein
MSTLDSSPQIAPRLGNASGKGLLALGALIAVGVAVLILALTGANRTTPTSLVTDTHPATTHLRVVQSHSTGVSNAVLDPLTGQMHGGGVMRVTARVGKPAVSAQAVREYVRAHRSYGAVP